VSQPILATVGLDPGLAIFRLHLRDEACLAVVPWALWLLPAPART
jgi:hypothetical protein